MGTLLHDIRYGNRTRVINPRLKVLGLIFLLCLPALRKLDGPSETKSLSDAHQMFLLRDAVSHLPRHSGFYQGEVACAFNNTVHCDDIFKQVLAAGPEAATAKQIHHIWAYVALRNGEYAHAMREMDALVLIDPQDSDAADTQPFVKALSGFPDQAIARGSLSKVTVQLKGGKLPVVINGKSASYFFDTGAGLSTLSASEALRLGIDIHDVSGSASDVNGTKLLFRVGLARSLSIGGIVMNNVAFLIASDEQQPFAQMDPGERGLIGLPVLLALGSIHWSPDGRFEADRTPQPQNIAASNLFFDDLMLITQAGFERQELPFIVDTGAETTDLWPKFAAAASDLIRNSSRRESHSVTGVGGEQKFEAISVPKVVLHLGGQSVVLQPAHLLQTQQRPVGQWFYGNIGIDLFGQGKSVLIDFRKMTLDLQTR
jgi:hypothetical protein